jgi:hypothetical protein
VINAICKVYPDFITRIEKSLFPLNKKTNASKLCSRLGQTRRSLQKNHRG